MATATATVWIKPREVQQRLALTPRQLRTLLEHGGVTTRKLPGLRVEVLASDVERIAAESVRPAKARA